MSNFERNNTDRTLGNRLVLTAGILVIAMASFTTGFMMGRGHMSMSSEDVLPANAVRMPFDTSKTSHVFAKSNTGGTQTIVAANGDLDAANLAGIRAYLQQEAANFSRGSIKGPNGEVINQSSTNTGSTDATRVDVRYAAVPGGARITYTTSDKNMIRTLHSWFDSQGSAAATPPTHPHR